MDKRICFVTTLAKSYREFLLGLSYYLIEHHDYDVTFICSDDGKIGSVCNEHLHFIPVTMKRGIGLDGVKVIWKMYRIFKREKYDIVLYGTPNGSFYASFASRFAGIKNRLYYNWGLRYQGFTGWRRTVVKQMIKTICTNSSIIEVESFSILETAIQDGLYKREKASVIWNGSACGVDLKKFDYSKREEWRKRIRKELGIAENTLVFGYAGRLNKDKGINELVEAFSCLKEEDNVALLLIGDYDDVGTTITPANINRIETGGKIKHVSYTPNLEQYYAALDVFCSLSYREGFGLVVIEAGAMGAPAVVSNVPGQYDTIIANKTGILAEVKDVDSTRKALQFYIDNPDKVKEYGQNAYKHVVDNYDSVKLFEKLAEHRDQIIKQSHER